MMLPDVNLLVYAVDATSPFHARARRWWDDALSSTLSVAARGESRGSGLVPARSHPVH